MKKIYRILSFVLCIVVMASMFNIKDIDCVISHAESISDYELPSVFPDTGQKCWVVFREGYRNSRIEMSTCEIVGNAEDAWIEWDRGLYLRGGDSAGKYNQYKLDGDVWTQIGSYHLFSDYATSVIASNMDIYNKSGELVLAKTDFYNTDATTPQSLDSVENIVITYEQYQAQYYSRNASCIVDTYMTYSEIEDNYTPTQYALNNILSFGWNKKFGFTDDAQVWEVILLDILLQNGASTSSIESWEKDSLKLSKELCEYIHENNIVDLDVSLTIDTKDKLSKIMEKVAGAEELSDTQQIFNVIDGFADVAETTKEFVDMYIKYINLRKIVDIDMKAFLGRMKNTNTYRDIPAFQRALDKVVDNIEVDSTKFVELIAKETASQEIVKKAVNTVVGDAVRLILGEEVYKLIDITKNTTVYLMNTICGTEQLAQSNIYLYMLDCIDDAASEAFISSAKSCLDSNGEKEFRAINGGLRFMTNLYTYGIGVCRKWSTVIATNVLAQMETGPYINVKRLHFDMANSYLNLNHSSTKEEKQQFLEEKCKQDEAYVNVVLENQPAFARIQWYHDMGASEEENNCLVIFKVQNPNGRFTLYAQIVPKYTAVHFPELSLKNGYVTPTTWYKDNEYKQAIDDELIITEDTTFYTSYIQNIFFEQTSAGNAKIISIKGSGTQLYEKRFVTANSNETYEIPPYIDGFKIVELGDDIFSSCPYITSVFIPSTIVTISDCAFESLSDKTQFKYVEGSKAESYIVNKKYQNTASERELIFKENIVNMKVGDNKQLELEQKGSSISEMIKWSSSNDRVAKVEDGLVTALKQGEATIIASTDSVSVTCEVKVNSSTQFVSPTVKGLTSSLLNNPPKANTGLKKAKLIYARNSKGKKLVAKWKKLNGAKGYQIQYATNKKFKKKKSVLTDRTKCMIKNLKKKTYYIKVRAYKTVKGKKIYGKWSVVKKVKIKK